MTYITPSNFTGLDGVILYVADAVPGFIALLLGFIFLLVTISIYVVSKNRNQNADFWAAASIGSFFTFVIATMMTFVPGLIDGFTLGTSLAFAVVFFAIFMVTQKSYS